ncbi:hypothetical protein GBA52_001279 [Prunus armeniaca]|nr:hypothetical protein GBA52_001279 [Prunus armeniaca]
MALVCRVLSAARRSLQPKALAISSSSQRWLSNQTSLLQRLVEEPNSRIKSILGSEEFSALQSSDFSWETLLTSLASSSSPDKSRLVLEWKLENLLEENEKDHDRYSELISLCGKIQNLPLAMQVFTSMEANGIKPTSAIFNSLVHACFSSGNVSTAFSLFEIMESSEGFKPNSDTYDAFMSAFSKLGKADSVQAWYSAKKAAGFSSDVQTYQTLISGCIKSNNFKLADWFYEEMVLSGLMPNLPILENMLEGLCKRRSFDQVICSYFRCSAHDRLELFLERLKGSYELTKSTYDLLIAGYRRAGLSDRLNDMKCAGFS